MKCHTLLPVLFMASPALAQTSLAPFNYSGSVSDNYGHSLATGDFDGDGLVDVAIGIPGQDVPSSTFPGQVDVHMGDGTVRNITSPWPVARGLFGFALAAGDLDLDGLDELVVGAPNERAGGPTSGLAYGGAHYVFANSGYSVGTGVWNFKFSAGTTIGASKLGESVTILPDPVQRGGGATPRQMWAASSPKGPAGMVSPRQGYIDVYDGLTGAWHTTFGPTAGHYCPNWGGVLHGPQGFGKTIVGGDFDGDGFGDIASTYIFIDMGTWDPVNLLCGGYRSGGRGFAVYNSAPATGAFNILAPMDGVSFIRFDGNLEQLTLAAPGDVNNDGIDDIAYGDWVGDPGGTYPLHVGGYVGFRSPVLGSTAPDINSFEGNGIDGNNMGSALAAGGDINGDGRGDLVARSTTAVRWVSNGDTVFGNPTTDNFLVDFAEQDLPANTIVSLAMGDVNNDGWIDVLAGDPTNRTVTVTSPGNPDPQVTLSTLSSKISAQTGGNVVLYMNPSGTINPNSFYFMLLSDQYGPGYVCSDSSQLMLDETPFYDTSLANPFLYFPQNLEFFGNKKTAITRIAARPGALTPWIYEYFYAGNVVVNPPAPFYTHSASDVLDIEVIP